MKRRIFLVCLFYCFFRLPIYESIAAIFWQYASYVFRLQVYQTVSIVRLRVYHHSFIATVFLDRALKFITLAVYSTAFIATGVD